MTKKRGIEGESNEEKTSVEAVKEILTGLQENPDQVYEPQDELDYVIRELIRIEKKHLYQIEKTSVQRRRQEVRELIESSVPKAMGLGNDS
jgi:hypothetical protein